MRTSFLFASLTALAIAASAGPASAYDRHTTITTARGTYTHTVDAYCFDGTCYREGQLVGVNGYTLQHSGMCTETAPGVWSCTGTVTGPNGVTATRSGQVTIVRN